MDDNKESIIMEIQESELTEMISINVICRLCANQNDKLIGIYSEDGINNDLANKMNLYLPVKVNETDDLPLQCCWQCASTVLAWHELVVTSVEADRRLRSYQFVTEKQLEDVELNFQTEQNLTTENKDEYLQNKETKGNENVIHDIVISDDDNNENVEYLQNTRGGTSSGEYFASNSLTEYKNCINFETKTCKLCDKGFDTKLSLKRHMRDSHNLREAKYRRKKCEIDPTFMCPSCNKSFTRKYDMQRHFISKHPNEKSSMAPTKCTKNLEILEKCRISTPRGSQYKCDICSHIFKIKHSFLRHRNIHTNERVYSCEICGKKFLAASAVVRHVNQLHYGIKNFTCDVCGKEFGSKASKDEHMNIHTNTRRYVCHICGKAFRQRSSLHVHKLFHSNKLPFSCGICGKKYRRRRDLKVHQWKHTGEKPYQCKLCDASFRLSQDLKRHSKIHVKYPCDVCGIKFPQEKCFTKHLLKTLCAAPVLIEQKYQITSTSSF